MEAGTGITCPRCAAENPANAKFCQRCWAFLRGRHCPHCGKQATRAGARYCEHCNRDLEAEPTTPLPRVDDDPAEPRVRSVPWLQPRDPVDDLRSLDEPPMAHAGAPPEPMRPEPAPPREPIRVRAAEAAEVHGAIDHEPVAPVVESTPDDQFVQIPIELPEAPGHPFLPPPPSRAVAQPSPQPAAPAPAAPQQRQEPKRSKKTPQPQRRSGSPAVTVAVVLIVVAVIGALLALRKQRGEIASQAAASPTQRAAASPAQPAAAPSALPASPAGAPTQTAPMAGTVKITTTPAGAQVELDWVHVGVTTTPLTLTDVRPGKHTIKVSKTGFQSQIRDVQVTGGELIVLELTLPGSPSPSGPRRRPAVPPPPPPLPPSP